MIHIVLKYNKTSQRRVDNGFTPNCADIVGVFEDETELNDWLAKASPSLKDDEKFYMFEVNTMVLTNKSTYFL